MVLKWAYIIDQVVSPTGSSNSQAYMGQWGHVQPIMSGNQSPDGTQANSKERNQKPCNEFMSTNYTMLP